MVLKELWFMKKKKTMVDWKNSLGNYEGGVEK